MPVSLKLDQLDKLAAQLKVLSHPKRLQIIDHLSQPNIKPQSVTEIYTATNLPQAIASQHLIILKDRGVLSSNKVGTKIYYAVAAPWVGQILATLKKQADAPAPRS